MLGRLTKGKTSYRVSLLDLCLWAQVADKVVRVFSLSKFRLAEKKYLLNSGLGHNNSGNFGSQNS